MIQLNRNYNLPEKAKDEIPIKVVGVGGAGLNVLDRIDQVCTSGPDRSAPAGRFRSLNRKTLYRDALMTAKAKPESARP